VSITKAGKRKTSLAANCASRTAYNDGERIHRAVQAQQRAALRDYRPKARTDEEWRELCMRWPCPQSESQTEPLSKGPGPLLPEYRERRSLY
jgi:hypothetical protein